MSELPEFARQRLRQQPAGDHPDANVLAGFAEQSLTAGERDRVLAHLAACADCREVASLVTASPEAPLSLGTMEPARSSVSWFRWSVLRWGAVSLTAVLIAVGAFLYLPMLQVHQVATFSKPTAAEAPAAPEMRAAPAVTRTQPSKAKAAPVDELSDRLAFKADKKGGRSAAGLTAQNAARERTDLKGAVVGGAAGGVTGGIVVAPAAVQAAKSAPVPAEVHGNLAKATVEASKTQSSAPAAAAPARARAEGASVMMDAAVPAPPPPPPQETTNAASAMVARQATSLAAPRVVVANSSLSTRWRVAADGSLERLTASDGWQRAPVAANVSFRTVSVVGSEVWAGGSAGALFHSLDFGNTWKRVAVRAGDAVLSAEITRVEFTDALHGGIATANGQRWITSDGGLTWRQQ